MSRFVGPWLTNRNGDRATRWIRVYCRIKRPRPIFVERGQVSARTGGGLRANCGRALAFALGGPSIRPHRNRVGRKDSHDGKDHDDFEHVTFALLD
jgi:hypothetical protein